MRSCSDSVIKDDDASKKRSGDGSMCVRTRISERGTRECIYSPSNGFVHNFGTPLEDGGDDAGLKVCAYARLQKGVNIRSLSGCMRSAYLVVT